MENKINWEECPIGKECRELQNNFKFDNNYVKEKIHDIYEQHHDLKKDIKETKKAVNDLNIITTKLSTKITFWGFIFSVLLTGAVTIIVELVIKMLIG